MKSSELKRWLTKLGATFASGKGSHLHIFLNGRRSILPMHNREVSSGVLNRIKKDLGLKDEGGK
jgi:mRNA interferase HicA